MRAVVDFCLNKPLPLFVVNMHGSKKNIDFQGNQRDLTIRLARRIFPPGS